MMPLIQKIIQVGDSRAVTIPKSWLIFYERQYGQNIKEVSVEVNGKLTIRPIFLSKKTEITEQEQRVRLSKMTK
jgi:antitoxin component of MazEF toxin-antitoxin module